MTISEIKSLTKFLTDEDVEKIKEEIKSKEKILKSGNLEEEELGNVLNSLFAILVIEKTLESQIDDVEEIRKELEDELLLAYQTYDEYILRYKKDEKKKKKHWLLNFLAFSDLIHDKKTTIGKADKSLAQMKSELEGLQKQKSDNNLRKVVNKEGDSYESFKDYHDKNCPVAQALAAEAHRRGHRGYNHGHNHYDGYDRKRNVNVVKTGIETELNTNRTPSNPETEDRKTENGKIKDNFDIGNTYMR